MVAVPRATLAQSNQAEGVKLVADGPRSLVDRLGRVIELTLPKIGPEAARQLEQLLSPTSLGVVAGILAAWVVGHAFGIGELVDTVLAVVGVVSIGLAVFSGLDELYLFAKETYSTSGSLDRAADHLANAISILGIQAVLAVLFRNRPRIARGQIEGSPRAGATFQLEPPPPATPGTKYVPAVMSDSTLPAGNGATSWWGDITLSTQGTTTDQALVELHERVHQFLAPKLYTLRNVRVLGRTGSYVGSSLYRYFEEALAETVARVGVQGFRKFFVGIRFPVENGYLYLMRPGTDPRVGNWGGRGIVPEGAGLLATITAAGMNFQLWFKSGTSPDVARDQRARERQ